MLNLKLYQCLTLRMLRMCRWVKDKAFGYYPSEGNQEDEWNKCIRAIDTKNRGVKRKQYYKENIAPCPPTP